MSVVPLRCSGSVSVVMVVEDEAPAAALLHQLTACVSSCFQDVELLLVASGAGEDTTRALHQLLNEVPDATAMFLPRRIDAAVARIIGMENAVGDWLLLLTPTASEIAALPEFLKAPAPNADIILAQGQGSSVPRGVSGWLQTLYFRLYDGLNGTRLQVDAPSMRLYSRSAGLHLVHSFEGEMLLRSDVVPGGFLTQSVPCSYELPRSSERGFWSSVSKALSALVSSGTLPLRFVSVTSMLMSSLALSYAMYVVAVYLTYPGVERGWTTLSLQMSGMMFLIALMFGLLAEYILQIHGASVPRRRHVILREIRSPHSRRASRLNVVNAAGDFRLGAPDLQKVAS